MNKDKLASIGCTIVLIFIGISAIMAAVHLGTVMNKDLAFAQEVKLACYELGFSEYDIVDDRAFCIWNGFVIEIKMEIEDDSF